MSTIMGSVPPATVPATRKLLALLAASVAFVKICRALRSFGTTVGAALGPVDVRDDIVVDIVELDDEADALDDVGPVVIGPAAWSASPEQLAAPPRQRTTTDGSRRPADGRDRAFTDRHPRMDRQR